MLCKPAFGLLLKSTAFMQVYIPQTCSYTPQRAIDCKAVLYTADTHLYYMCAYPPNTQHRATTLVTSCHRTAIFTSTAHSQSKYTDTYPPYTQCVYSHTSHGDSHFIDAILNLFCLWELVQDQRSYALLMKTSLPPLPPTPLPLAPGSMLSTSPLCGSGEMG